METRIKLKISTPEPVEFRSIINIIIGFNRPKNPNIIGNIIEIIKKGEIVMIMYLVLVNISSV